MEEARGCGHTLIEGGLITFGGRALSRCLGWIHFSCMDSDHSFLVILWWKLDGHTFVMLFGLI